MCRGSKFVNGFVDVLTLDDAMAIGLDACQDKKVYHGYDDRESKTRKFYFNGLAYPNTLFGHDEFKHGSWNVVGGYDEVAGWHQAFYVGCSDRKGSDKSWRKDTIRGKLQVFEI